MTRTQAFESTHPEVSQLYQWRGFWARRGCGKFLSFSRTLLTQPALFDFEENYMALDRSDVEHLAHLARIGLKEAEIPAYADKLSSIMGLIDRRQAVDTRGVQPLAHPLEPTPRLRADVVTEDNQRDALQAIAPATEQGLYLVPRVIE